MPTYHLKPVTSSQYILKGDAIKIRVSSKNTDREYFLLYSATKKLIPTEYMDKHHFREGSVTFIPYTWDACWEVTGEANEEKDIIRATSIKGDWISAEDYLNQHYPLNKNEENKERWKIDLKNKGLTGELDLTRFTKLEEVNCEDNCLTSIKTPSTVKKIFAGKNRLTSMSNLDCTWENLEDVDINDNPLDIQEFATLFIKIKALENHQRIREDERNSLDSHKSLLSETTDKLNEANKKSDDWTSKYKLLEEENKKLKQAQNQTILNKEWWIENKTPLLWIGGILLLFLAVYSFFKKCWNPFK